MISPSLQPGDLVVISSSDFGAESASEAQIFDGALGIVMKRSPWLAQNSQYFEVYVFLDLEDPVHLDFRDYVMRGRSILDLSELILHKIA